MNELPPNIKVLRADAKSTVVLPKSFVVDDDVEIYCGAATHIDIRSLTIKGCGNKIIVGDRSLVRSATISITGEACTLKIGSNFRCGPTRFLLNKKSITIGDDVLFSHGITIRTSDARSIVDIETEAALNPPEDVVIGNRVWIGQDCFVHKGVVIGDGTVISDRAVVAGEVPANVIAAGMPARVRRRGIRWSRETP
jgi:acetyltransferase-like isoleucine patch superfamily enzyme